MTYSNDDYEEGTSMLDKVIYAPGDGQNQHKEVALRLTAAFAQARSSMFGKPEYLEQAIHSTRTFLGEAALEDPLHPTVMYRLMLLHGKHFDDSGISDHRPFRDLTASLTELNAENDHDKHFDAILSINRVFDKVEVEEAIEYCRLLLASSHPDSDFAHLAAVGLCVLLHRAFSCTKKIKYLNEEISVSRDLCNNRFGGANFSVILGFISSLRMCFELLGLREDFYKIMQLFPIAVNDERPRTPDRFQVSCDWDLEVLTLKISPNSNGDNRVDGPVRMDPFGHLVIQALPGFETFMNLKSPSFDKLHFGAARGPVVTINHCRWRSVIFIILHNSPPSLISTGDDFYYRANNLLDLLLDARKECLDSNQYEDALSSVLKGLYELVGRPVIQRLDESNVPKQSRVRWCPTSVFCSLTLHAMGPIP
ncbi:hypothetical protein BGY98DRAFT_1094241 [Russula aff. rugulosa BPL654]|nr:hypothetical protein BGY98DRAFT_1094241 [Russula aff. rugulosa BPL654]